VVSTLVATILQPDGQYLFGRFDYGVIELEITKIDGEPSYIYGNVDEFEMELECLVYNIPTDRLDEIETRSKYKLFWMETICLMEPFDHGFQRCFIR